MRANGLEVASSNSSRGSRSSSESDSPARRSTDTTTSSTDGRRIVASRRLWEGEPAEQQQKQQQQQKQEKQQFWHGKRWERRRRRQVPGACLFQGPRQQQLMLLRSTLVLPLVCLILSSTATNGPHLPAVVSPRHTSASAGAPAGAAGAGGGDCGATARASSGAPAAWFGPLLASAASSRQLSQAAGSEAWRATWAVSGWSRRRKKFPREESLRDVKENRRGVANAGMEDTLNYFDNAAGRPQLATSPFSTRASTSPFALLSSSSPSSLPLPPPSTTAAATAGAAAAASAPAASPRPQRFNATLQALSVHGSPFLTEVEVGSSKQRFTALVDTATDLFWLPCNCIQCANASSVAAVPVSPPYDPTLSSSSQSIFCRSPSCSSFAAADKTASVGCLVSSALPAPDPLCQYAATYTGPEGGSVGNLVRDALHAAVAVGSRAAANVTFGGGGGGGGGSGGGGGGGGDDGDGDGGGGGGGDGSGTREWCGRYQTGFLAGTSVAPEGVFGMGRGALSPLSQLAAQGLMSNAFSLCMEGDAGARAAAQGAGAGGAAGGAAGEGVPAGAQSTAIVSSELEPFYFINVTGMAVGNATLPLPPATFPPLNESGNGGTILDSSASLTVLPTQAYQAMATQYLVALPQLKYDYALSDQQGVDCLNASAYAQPSESAFMAQFPALSLILADGAIFTVQPPAYLYLISADVICFAITPSPNSNQHTIIP
ncbi:hypothetical protein CLOM_g13796, partial [Closterium sp. NIES-68]